MANRWVLVAVVLAAWLLGACASTDDLEALQVQVSVLQDRVSELEDQVAGFGRRIGSLRRAWLRRHLPRAPALGGILMLSAGVDVRTVAGRLGHSNASITLNTYAHYVRSADEAAAEKMGEVLADG